MFNNQEQDYIFYMIENGKNFRNKFSLNNKIYHYSENTLFKAQLYRVFSLLANKLGINSVEYDYIKKNGKVIIFCESMISDDEELVEYGIGGDEFSLENTFKSAIHFGLRNSTDELYRQVFYSLLIRDIDKNVAFIKKNKKFTRIAPYFDYDGICCYTDDLEELDLDCYYDLVAKKETLSDLNYTDADLEREFSKVLNKFLNVGVYQFNNDDYIKNLSLCLNHLDSEFIYNCLNVNIDEIMSNDRSHHYSNNFKKVIINMFEIEKEIMNKQLSLLNKSKKVK